MGIAAANEIRSRFNIPIIFLTAYTDDKILERASITGPFGYIVKPFVNEDLKYQLKLPCTSSGWRKKENGSLKSYKAHYRRSHHYPDYSLFVLPAKGYEMPMVIGNRVMIYCS